MAPWIIAHQAPLSMGFSRQEYWSGLGCLVFATINQVVGPSKKLLLIKEKQTSQVNELSAFLYMGRCKNLGLVEVISWRRTLAISSQYPNFSIPDPSGCPDEGGHSGWWLDGCHILRLLLEQVAFFVHLSTPAYPPHHQHTQYFHHPPKSPVPLDCHSASSPSPG